ncbi:Primosomal protein N' [Phycisphaerae bacterium RAS1]|nr:Primosomal protein N' [Phycisphaerae bacterium RAS1]
MESKRAGPIQSALASGCEAADNPAAIALHVRNAPIPTPNEQLWLIPAAGQTRMQPVAEVAVRLRTYRPVTFGLPAEAVDCVRPGSLVRVPARTRGRLIDGLCLRVSQEPWRQTRPQVATWFEPEIALDESLVELGLWLSGYYLCPPWLVFALMVPAAMRRGRLRRIEWLERSGGEVPRLSAGQRRLLDAVGPAGAALRDALRRAEVGRGTLARLLKRGLLTRSDRDDVARPLPAESSADALPGAVNPAEGGRATPEDEYTLTAAQEAALAQIAGALASVDPFRVLLLFGVPGSGKTEVYVRAIRRVIAAGRQAILLVPEIALVTQIVDRLVRRFARVAVLHSQLTPKTRREALRRIAAGTVDVVIGTRTAALAPCRRLGLIVVDEEQESSFKSLASPFYHARDVAIKRGQIERIPVVLGSATPSLESWHNAHTSPHFTLLNLNERVPGASLPRVRIVAPASGEEHDGLLSAELRDELARTIGGGGQAILLHNRRGYAPWLRCTACGALCRCPRCNAAMVFHQPKEMRCHRCGQRGEAPGRCPDKSCGGRLERAGQAIQKLEETLRVLLPQARLLRLDRDTMRRRHDYQAALRSFEAHEADILLGTQMVAKGLDFPLVRLVGVIDADAALSLPDFRAAERVFQLLMQVAGRAGRREGESLALIQPVGEVSDVLTFAVRMDYTSFAAAERAARQRYGLPPFSRMIRLIGADERPGRARDEMAAAAERLRKLAPAIHPEIHVDDATACVIPRLREMLRYDVVLRGPRDGVLQKLIERARDEKQLWPNVKRFTVDVDPIELL